MSETPAALSEKGGGSIVTKTDAQGHERPASATYQASCPLEDPEQLLVMGGTGHAKIKAGYQTLASRVWRIACRTFNFEL